ncbi:MAG: hypothetical protein RQ741_06815 [Wenzhouxiangellaceae bacterium]|nr:hypothetical protein [Wenzhouxiangellaceae bacterium]
MSAAPHHIRLLAGFEVRPASTDARFEFDRPASERLGRLIADDLAACVAEVVDGHLVTGPALLEPGQLTSPQHTPWAAMLNLASLDKAFAPGITSIGTPRGQMSHATLGPYRLPPQGLFLCLPILLALTEQQAPRLGPALESALERRLFEHGGLKPPAMGTLAELTGLDPVHGQLMTETDLMALLKMQLAGAGLDPFWPPVEHALLSPDQPVQLELPAGLVADWNLEARGWEIPFQTLRQASVDIEQYALWLRAFRQTTALLENHLVAWRTRLNERDVEAQRVDSPRMDEHGGWVLQPAGRQSGPNRAWSHQHPSVGLIACSAVIDGALNHYYPLHAEAIGELEQHFRDHGIARIEPGHDPELLRSIS